MSYISVDIEADGPAPGVFSMIELGAVIVEPGLGRTFHGKLRPISENFKESALQVSNNTREKTIAFEPPEKVMKRFLNWVKENSKGRPIFISDNNGFDFAFVNYYFHRFCGENPFGWSSRRIGDLYCGMKMNAWAPWKHLRETQHDHNPVNDAKGNAEALIKMKEMGLQISFE